ncbi:uncharacterized protein V1518DRAFT_411096 [Limtongia smithiae]|uniref:uncharacterized protein n=1 Tax=Limtongia smithiae TaxID=1125753 RepID=UPI0034CD4C7D
MYRWAWRQPWRALSSLSPTSLPTNLDSLPPTTVHTFAPWLTSSRHNARPSPRARIFRRSISTTAPRCDGLYSWREELMRRAFLDAEPTYLELRMAVRGWKRQVKKKRKSRVKYPAGMPSPKKRRFLMLQSLYSMYEHHFRYRLDKDIDSQIPNRLPLRTSDILASRRQRTYVYAGNDTGMFLAFGLTQAPKAPPVTLVTRDRRRLNWFKSGGSILTLRENRSNVIESSKKIPSQDIPQTMHDGSSAIQNIIICGNSGNILHVLKALRHRISALTNVLIIDGDLGVLADIRKMWSSPVSRPTVLLGLSTHKCRAVREGKYDVVEYKRSGSLMVAEVPRVEVSGEVSAIRRVGVLRRLKKVNTRGRHSKTERMRIHLLRRALEKINTEEDRMLGLQHESKLRLRGRRGYTETLLDKLVSAQALGTVEVTYKEIITEQIRRMIIQSCIGSISAIVNAPKGRVPLTELREASRLIIRETVKVLHKLPEVQQHFSPYELQANFSVEPLLESVLDVARRTVDDSDDAEHSAKEDNYSNMRHLNKYIVDSGRVMDVNTPVNAIIVSLVRDIARQKRIGMEERASQ